ncbi:beta-1,4-glucuronyltransferase 1-like isoform X1 [Malaya genurostris]|uniref:beta-1,4-glucuronyltransferase 1-like isoform X1 n=1 Tax=Malaya genurostris TaxID=325434 RepID=UPI0026F3A26A|nr:beta-1,4-glucuronyltransferase 1-like isoform X1 [Malaya genurostris]
MSVKGNVAYSRLNANRTHRKSTILRIVLPLVTLSFVLFCTVGYFSSKRTHHVYSPHPKQYPDAKSYVNQSHLMEELRFLLNCKSVDSSYRIEQHGSFWVLKNFITPVRAQPVRCYETITYTTHGDHRYLENIIPLLERWRAPISVAMYAPGIEFDIVVAKLRFLMFCHQRSDLIDEYATIHLYFDFDQLPANTIDFYSDAVQDPLDCSSSTETQLTEVEYISNRSYPVNVGRNIARDAAQTHFVLASDIELYPNPDFVEMFLRMIVDPDYRYTLGIPSVYVLPIFEVTENSSIPEDKIDLLRMMKHGQAVKFHEKICERCHTVPNYAEWLQVVKADQTMDILSSTEKKDPFQLWEPIYVGTKLDPPYDERLYWEGKFDKMTQVRRSVWHRCHLNLFDYFIVLFYFSITGI